MASKQPPKTTFEVDKVIQPIFTGGSASLDNGARILATSLDEDVVLTDLTTGQRLAEIEGDGEIITTLTLTPSASHLILCSRSLSMRIYALKVAPDYESVETTLVRTLKPHGTPVVVLAVDRTGTLLATGAADGTIKVWDIVGGYVTHTFRGPSVLVSVLHFFEIAASSSARSSDPRRQQNGRNGAAAAAAQEGEDGDSASSTANFRLACGSQDGKIRVWDLHTRKTVPVDEKGNHVSSVQGLDYSADQHALVTGSRDKTITWWQWDARTWRPRKVIQCAELVESVGFLDQGRRTYSAGPKGVLRIWDTETGRELTKEQAAKSESEGIVATISVPQKSLILCIQADHTLVLYRAPSSDDSKPATLVLEPFRRISGTHDDILDLAYLLPDRSMMALATNSEDVRLISIAAPSSQQQQQQQQLDGDEDQQAASVSVFGEDVALLKGHEDMVVSLDVDWSGHWIATGAKDNSARLWRIDAANRSYTCYAVFTGHAESLGAVALPKTVPADTSDAFKDPLSHPPPFVLTGSKDQTIKKWEIPRQPMQGSGKGGRALFTRKAHDKDINCIDTDASGLIFASASQDKFVKIWDAKTGEVQGILKGHRRGVWSVKFAPPDMPAIQGEQNAVVSGRRVVLTGSTDKTVKLWSLSDFTCLRTFEGHSNSVLRVAWLKMPSAAGEGGGGGKSKSKQQQPVQFASAGADGLVKVWDANLGEAACTLDNHEGRVWALAVHPGTNAIVSGSEDSTVSFWRDTTAETQAEAAAAALRLVEQEQELENYMHAGSYRDAILLALQLNHPGRLLGLFTRVVTSADPEPGSLSGLKAVDTVLAGLSDEQLFLLLLRLRDWNTNARTAPVAQRVLAVLVRSYPAARLAGLSVRGARGQKSLREVLDALRVYTERHYKRMEELVDESYLVEYTLQEMDALAPADSTSSLSASASLVNTGSSADAVMADAR